MKFVLFGATGDLAQKKVLPALRALNAAGAGLDVIEVSRRSAVSVDVEAGTGYEALAERLGSEGGAIIYLSLAPHLHAKAVVALGERGLLVRGKTRLMIEKPFGTDGKSAEALQAVIDRYLGEDDVYRVDHYLGKEAVQRAMGAKGSGAEAVNSITSVRVRLFEEKGIDGRGASYDGVGAFRDVGQNHLLEAAAVFLADPADVAAKGWQEARAIALRALVPPRNTCGDFLRGQYDGYLAEKGVAPGSQTETAFRVVTLERGIRVTLEAGKRMPRAEASVEVSRADGSVERHDLRAGRDAYERVIEAALQGSRREFVGMGEVRALWDYADRAALCWDEVPLQTYGDDRPFLIK